MTDTNRCSGCGQRYDAWYDGWAEGARGMARLWDAQLRWLGRTVTTPHGYGPDGDYYTQLYRDAESRITQAGYDQPGAA